MVLATKLKRLIFRISARIFFKNFCFRKELKLFALVKETSIEAGFANKIGIPSLDF